MYIIQRLLLSIPLFIPTVGAAPSELRVSGEEEADGGVVGRMVDVIRGILDVVIRYGHYIVIHLYFRASITTNRRIDFPAPSLCMCGQSIEMTVLF